MSMRAATSIAHHVPSPILSALQPRCVLTRKHDLGSWYYYNLHFVDEDIDAQSD